MNAPSGISTGQGSTVPGRPSPGQANVPNRRTSAPAPGQRTMGVIARLSADDRHKALNLPVVKELMEQFDLTLMGVRDEAPVVPPPSENNEDTPPEEED